MFSRKVCHFVDLEEAAADYVRLIAFQRHDFSAYQ
jgi:hypothetical protein